MGLDLTLIPLRGSDQLRQTTVHCPDSLNLDRDYNIFGQLTAAVSETKPTIISRPIPSSLWISFNAEEGLKRTRQDKYGAELTFLYAEELKKLQVKESVTPWNKAVKALIDALPDDTPIILLWR